jgi:RNA polymerase sigma-70 factor (ECF subfamily)
VSYPENSLAHRFLKNDPEAVGQVIRWISTALTAPRFWSLRPEWSDLLQETFLRTTQSLRSGHFDSSRDFRVYVQGISRIVCLQALGEQAESARREFDGEVPEAGTTAPASSMVDRQLARRVLDLASQECRELFRLYYLEGKDYQEIASAAGVPVGTVKSRLFRCLESAFEDRNHCRGARDGPSGISARACGLLRLASGGGACPATGSSSEGM